jgi:hypothetical protein
MERAGPRVKIITDSLLLRSPGKRRAISLAVTICHSPPGEAMKIGGQLVNSAKGLGV